MNFKTKYLLPLFLLFYTCTIGYSNYYYKLNTEISYPSKCDTVAIVDISIETSQKDLVIDSINTSFGYVINTSSDNNSLPTDTVTIDTSFVLYRWSPGAEPNLQGMCTGSTIVFSLSVNGENKDNLFEEFRYYGSAGCVTTTAAGTPSPIGLSTEIDDCDKIKIEITSGYHGCDGYVFDSSSYKVINDTIKLDFYYNYYKGQIICDCFGVPTTSQVIEPLPAGKYVIETKYHSDREVESSGSNIVIIEAPDLYSNAYVKKSSLIVNEGICSTTVLGKKGSTPTEITAYPNPTKGLVSFNKQVDEINVFDQQSHLVFHTNNSNSIDVSHLPNGTYELETVDNNQRNVQLLIKID